MGRMEQIMVAVTAVVALIFSTGVLMTLGWLWRNPPGIQFEKTRGGAVWRLGDLSAELQVEDGQFEQLVVWRGAADIGAIPAP